MLRRMAGAVLLIMLAALSPQELRADSRQREWTIDDLPMVHLKDSRRYLVNPDGLVSAAAEDSCNRYMQAMERQKGIQTVFVVVGHLKGSDDLATLSSRLGDKYGVGDRKTSRGLVIIIAAKDRKWFIAPGSGLQGEYPDITVGSIGRRCIAANMRRGDTDAAALSTCRAFYSGQPAAGTEPDDDGGSFAAKLAALVLICVLIGIIITRRGGGRGGRRGGGGFFFFGGPPFFGGGHGGGGFSGGGFSGGGSFGGGSFNGGGAGGSW